ncbi:MAG TPA: murein biosynthesis integral membrane protein MurJ [Anaerolineales bacterium]|nr:murein biosynthesis integral membrane protein MurJ [Anaerolineales bacterium]
MSETTSKANQQIARASGTVMFAFAISQVAGLVRQILVTKTFGTGPEWDAFSAAIVVPNLLFSLVAGGALASAFVPTFTTLLSKNDRPGAWRLFSALVNAVTLVLAASSLLAAIFAPQIVHLLWPDYQQALATQLLRILLITSAIFGVSGIVSGVLNAHQRFLLPSLASTMYWLGWIIGLLFFVPSMGILGLAWGAVLGSVMHLGIQLPNLFRLPERRYTATLGAQNPNFKEVVLLMGPRLIGVATVQLNLLLNTIIANYLPAGQLGAINFAFPIMTVPLVIIGSGIGFATLPTFSAQVASGQYDELKDSITTSLRSVLFLSLPATAGLILLARPLIAFLFQHGKFTGQSTDWVAWALILYTIGLVGHATLEVVVRAFYALHDTKTPVLVGATAMIINLLLSVLLVIVFPKLGWAALGGLALSTSVAAYIETGALFLLLRKRLKGIQGRRLARGTGAAILGSLVMAVALLFWLQLTKTQSTALTTLGGVVIGGIVYGLSMILLRVPEVGSIFQAFKRRFLGK